MPAESHLELHQLRLKLQEIYTASTDFRPLSLRLPILDSSVNNNESCKDSPWSHQEQIPGLCQLRESIRLDLDVLNKVGGLDSVVRSPSTQISLVVPR